MRSRATSVFLGAVVVIVAACTQATPPDAPGLRLERARALAHLEVEGGGLEETLDLGASLAAELTADALVLELGREPTVEEQAAVERVMRSSLAEILTAEDLENAAAQVYAGHFTVAELEDSLAFFGSPTGTKILDLQGRIDRELGAAVEAVVETRLDDFIASVDEGLARELPGLGAEESP
jgi:SepF-like predicted cell division protein (DUF552 family)